MTFYRHLNIQKPDVVIYREEISKYLRLFNIGV